MDFCTDFLKINGTEIRISLHEIMWSHTLKICSHLLLLKV